MKKLFLLFALLAVFALSDVHAQTYTGAVGIGLGVGNGATLVGPSGKYFFAENHAGQADILFGNDVTALNLLYGYHAVFPGTDILQWYAGGGPSFLFGNNNSDVGLRPMVGLDLKLGDIPLAFTFDWRPYISFDDGSEAARFGLGIRYVFN